MQFHIKTLKICLVFLCLLAVRPVGLPQIDGATFCMGKMIIKSPKHGKHICLYDDADYKIIKKYKWHLHVHEKGKRIYAIAHIYKKGKDTKIYMHRLLMGFPKKSVDHRNCNGLDNRRCNLRVSTVGQNTSNQRMRSDNKSGYKGVWFNSDEQKYCANIQFNYKHISLGAFSSAILAAKAYNKGAIKYFGEFARLNKI